jgi:hypothetical protein
MSQKRGDRKQRRKECQEKKDQERGIERGAKRGVKHQPGRGHQRKSGVRKKESFKRRTKRKREEAHEAARRLWEWWDGLREDQRKLLVKLKPMVPRPHYGN